VTDGAGSDRWHAAAGGTVLLSPEPPEETLPPRAISRTCVFKSPSDTVNPP